MNKGKLIEDIVEKSQNPTWKIRLGDVLTSGDLVSRDILYHNSCHLQNWEKYIQRPSKKSMSSDDKHKKQQFQHTLQQAADIQFYAELQSRIDNGGYVSIVQAENLYSEILEEYHICKKPSRRTLFRMVEENIKNVNITSDSGPNPSQIHSTETAKSAILTAAEGQQNDLSQSLQDVMKCAKYLSQVILENRGWVFDGSLKDSLNSGIPAPLFIFIQWLLQGTQPAKSTACTTDVEQSAKIIGQHIIQAMKTDRQILNKDSSSVRTTIETPLAVGLSMTSYHAHRSKKDVSILNAAKIGISYGRVQKLTNQIANNAMNNADSNLGVKERAPTEGIS